MSPRVLVVDDDPESCAMLEEGLGLRGFAVRTCTSAERALAILGDDDGIEAVLTDLRMPGGGGMLLCRTVCDERPDVPVIVATAFVSIDTAVDAVRRLSDDQLDHVAATELHWQAPLTVQFIIEQHPADHP